MGGLKKHWLIWTTLGLWLCLAVAWVGIRILKGVAAEYRVIHKPAGGCPVGWELLPGKFSEADGQKVDGCLNPGDQAKHDVDYLLPGESVRIEIQIRGRSEP